MLSSTSSSDERLPWGEWGRAWLAAIVLAFVLLAAWDRYWVGLGFRALIDDEESAWFLAREAVLPGSTVLIGTSRIQADIVPREWARTSGQPAPIQLGIVSSSPLPILEDLASDETFRGLVLMDVIPEVVFDENAEGEEASHAMLAAAREIRASAARRLEARLSLFLSTRLAFRQPALNPGRVLAQAVDGDWPAPLFVRVHPDRFLEFDYARMDVEDRARRLVDELAAEERPGIGATDAVERVLERLDRAAARLRQRGGRVVFVHFPRCGALGELEEALYPRTRYWDRLSEITAAVSIQTEDFEEVRDFVCRDGSHIDPVDAPVFTRLLANAVFDSLGARAPAGPPGSGGP